MMGSDSISITFAPPKDFSKKKRNNRLTKLKQCKLDARREQWFSQAKVKDYKLEMNDKGDSPPPYMQKTDKQTGSMDNIEIRSKGNENDGSSIHDSDLESLLSIRNSGNLGNDLSKYRPGSSSSSVSSACSVSVSEEEEDDSNCLDDWEAIADALTAVDNRHNPVIEPPADRKTRLICTDPPTPDSSGNNLKPERKEATSVSEVPCRAWRQDDAGRPQSLPNLSKHHCGRGVISLEWQRVGFQPSSCPICCEDLDLTDTRFLPCPCGFRLCLFCHKRIIEADGRCPGCRKPYDSAEGHIAFNEGTMAL